jgi:glucose-6-phosphate dehydrogenase assembly protein OpcA
MRRRVRLNLGADSAVPSRAMPAVIETHSPGMPVEIDKIDRELKKLWQQGEGVMTRASLINLAIYSEKPGSLKENTQLIARITEDHACRAIVIEAERDVEQRGVEAWINAHCHLSRAGGKQICSEQLSFSLEGPCTKLLPSIVFSHLDSDLPFYLWWQGEFHDPMDAQLWEWVDRLIYDSQSWRDFAAQLWLAETAQKEARQRVVLCDLNWTRLDKIRFAIAQFFDHPASHHHFAAIENLNINYAPGFKSTALLLLGWLGAQLKWKVNEPAHNGSCRLVDSNNRKIDIELHRREGPPIGEITINSSGIQFRVAPAQCGDLLEVSRRGDKEAAVPQMMPAQSNDPADLLSQELLRGGSHQVYLRALNCVRDLL